MNAERIWEIKRTPKSKMMSILDRLDFQKGLQGQDINSRYLVLYNSSAKDANAMIVDRKMLPFEFIVESKAYVYFTDNLLEANYLVAILNSSIPNLMIKNFQTKGLFGPRDIHKNS